MSEFLIQDGETVVFAGDSITDHNRRDAHVPFGAGYVRQTIDLITARYPDRDITYFNEGISGNTVVDLRNRWYDDVLRHKPDWVTIKIGINDIHRFLFNPNEADKIPVALYEEAYRVILQRTKDAGAKIVLIDPFYMSQETDPTSTRKTVLDTLPAYLAVVEKLAAEFGTLHVRTHELYQEQLKYRPADRFGAEPVHPSIPGSIIIAHGLLGAIGW
ncbi:MAG TPA: SGNH/GDSL hydrolase family protein [Capsulimonadaceae bacterium]|jgi:lysophospholipase L1-like esterase